MILQEISHIITKTPDIVLDTKVIVAALRSQRGASNKLLSLIGTHRFEIHDSVALILEFGQAPEEAARGVNRYLAATEGHEAHLLGLIERIHDYLEYRR